ncbi:MAG: hypothetical protein N2C14_26290, partial [Planctomycetales bacterium]
MQSRQSNFHRTLLWAGAVAVVALTVADSASCQEPRLLRGHVVDGSVYSSRSSEAPQKGGKPYYEGSSKGDKVIHDGVVDGGVVYENEGGGYSSNTMFQNRWIAPVGGHGAKLYVSPRPVPPHVGHTYITYPPFQP